MDTATLATDAEFIFKSLTDAFEAGHIDLPLNVRLGSAALAALARARAANLAELTCPTCRSDYVAEIGREGLTSLRCPYCGAQIVTTRGGACYPVTALGLQAAVWDLWPAEGEGA